MSYRLHTFIYTNLIESLEKPLDIKILSALLGFVLHYAKSVLFLRTRS